MIDFSSEKYRLDTGTLGTSREIYSEDADGETHCRLGKFTVRMPMVTIGTLTVNFSTGINSTPSQQ